MLDHSLIGTLGRVAEGENAMLVEDKPLDRGIGFIDLRRHLGEFEPRRHIVDDAQSVAKYLPAQVLAVGLIDNR